MARKRTEPEKGKTVSIYLQPSEVAYLLTVNPSLTIAIRQIINERKEQNNEHS